MIIIRNCIVCGKKLEGYKLEENKFTHVNCPHCGSTYNAQWNNEYNCVYVEELIARRNDVKAKAV